MRSSKEAAYRYDLYVVPFWRDPCDEMVMKYLEIPRTGSILTVNCGTGGLALELAATMGDRGEVVATDADDERLELARAKAELKNLHNVLFLHRSSTDLGFEDYSFDLILGDGALMHPREIEGMLSELVHVTQSDGRVALLMLTRGSFGEVFSLLWEALRLCKLDGDTPHVEALINEHPTASQAHEIMRRQGLSHVHGYTEQRELNFESATELFESPLIEDYFMEHWLDFLPDASTRRQVIDMMSEIIERERGEAYVEISVKTTLLVGNR
jgi:ubiquinone/menaquinone biosynthesis C-methylase UbiE